MVGSVFSYCSDGKRFEQRGLVVSLSCGCRGLGVCVW